MAAEKGSRKGGGHQLGEIPKITPVESTRKRVVRRRPVLFGGEGAVKGTGGRDTGKLQRLHYRGEVCFRVRRKE